MLSISAPPLASRRPVRVVVPVTLKLSSIVVVPPEESIVRFPEEVSISLSPAIPIWILSIVAPPLASRRLLIVVIPETINWSSMVVVPPAEFIVRFPDLVSIVFDVAAPTLISPIYASLYAIPGLPI